MNFPLDIQFKRFTACVIICLCNKWLTQQIRENNKRWEEKGKKKKKERGKIMNGEE